MRVRSRQPRIGLALGAGATNGWAHIGVIRRLEEAGVVPDIVCGCSAGALVGAFYAAGGLDILEDWVRNLTVRRTLNYVRVRRGRSLFGKKLLKEMIEHLRGLVIEELDVPFAAVATDLQTGREITAQTGPLARAVAASGAFPLLFPPVKIDDCWAVDGCLVNPVPVSTCRALGADVVIAVRVRGRWGRLGAVVYRGLPELRRSEPGARRVPGFVSVALRAAVALTRRAKGADVRPDILVEPRLGRLSLSTEGALRAIAAGRSAAADVQSQLSSVLYEPQGCRVQSPVSRAASRPASGRSSARRRLSPAAAQGAHGAVVC